MKYILFLKGQQNTDQEVLLKKLQTLFFNFLSTKFGHYLLHICNQCYVENGLLSLRGKLKTVA